MPLPDDLPAPQSPVLLMTRAAGSLPAVYVGPLLRPNGTPTGLVVIRLPNSARDMTVDPATLRTPAPSTTDIPGDPWEHLVPSTTTLTHLSALTRSYLTALGAGSDLWLLGAAGMALLTAPSQLVVATAVAGCLTVAISGIARPTVRLQVLRRCVAVWSSLLCIWHVTDLPGDLAQLTALGLGALLVLNLLRTGDLLRPEPVTAD